jgi:hypothetical protein
VLFYYEPGGIKQKETVSTWSSPDRLAKDNTASGPETFIAYVLVFLVVFGCPEMLNPLCTSYCHGPQKTHHFSVDSQNYVR